MEGGRDPFSHFGGPFGSFGGFSGVSGFGDSFGGRFGSFGGISGFSGFGGHKSLISSFFGGHDPFDNPFFTSPFGATFGPSFIHSVETPFINPNIAGHISDNPPMDRRSSRPVIEELNSDDEKEDDEESRKVEGKDVVQNPRQHRRSKHEPLVEDPDDEITGKNRKHIARPTYVNQVRHLPTQPSHSFTFQSSTVSYGGANGAYYASSRTRTGSDGLMFEECKEADSSSGQASHRVTRGIADKGHSVTRKLSSGSGRVDTTQTLYNLEKDELAGFNETWNGNAQRHLPYWDKYQCVSQHQPYQHPVWALPPTQRSGEFEPRGPPPARHHHPSTSKPDSKHGTGRRA